MEKLSAKRCYELLGLPPGATLTQIREQRGRLAQQWHPDKETDPTRKARLEDKMKDINNAFDFLRTLLSRAPTGPAPTARGTPAASQPPTPAAKKPWEAEAEERRKRTTEREAAERREQAARKREWKAEFQRVQADAARQRVQQQEDAARLREWLAQEKERQEKERREPGVPPRDRRTGTPPLRRDADTLPPVRPEAPAISRPREPRPPARAEAGKSKHIYHSGKCTRCGRSKEQIAGYDLDCL